MIPQNLIKNPELIFTLKNAVSRLNRDWLFRSQPRFPSVTLQTLRTFDFMDSYTCKIQSFLYTVFTWNQYFRFYQKCK
jgi:hypothetical protein